MVGRGMWGQPGPGRGTLGLRVRTMALPALTSSPNAPHAIRFTEGHLSSLSACTGNDTAPSPAIQLVCRFI